jgi:hypothetical protein
MAKRSEDVALQAFLFTLASDFLHAIKSYDKGPPAFPSKERCAADLYYL